MTRYLCFGMALSVFGLIAFAAQDVVTAAEGTVKKIDAGAKTVVVRTADGAEHTVRFVSETTVHGAEKTAEGSKDAFHGLKEGSTVVVHYTANGAEWTAREVDHIGEGGMKVTEGTVSAIDRGGKTIVVKTANGAEETYRLTGRAAKDAGAGAEKSAKVSVYYTEEAGHKVAHFFKKVF